MCAGTCACACVCIFCIIMLEHLSIYIYKKMDNIFHLDVHYVCMLVQRLEPQGRCFANFHHYYYYYNTNRSRFMTKKDNNV